MTTKTLSGPAAIDALPRGRLLGEFSLWSADLINMETDLKRIEVRGVPIEQALYRYDV